MLDRAGFRECAYRFQLPSGILKRFRKLQKQPGRYIEFLFVFCSVCVMEFPLFLIRDLPYSPDMLYERREYLLKPPHGAEVPESFSYT